METSKKYNEGEYSFAFESFVQPGIANENQSILKITAINKSTTLEEILRGVRDILYCVDELNVLKEFSEAEIIRITSHFLINSVELMTFLEDCFNKVPKTKLTLQVLLL
jgi:hypothetical protein